MKLLLAVVTGTLSLASGSSGASASPDAFIVNLRFVSDRDIKPDIPARTASPFSVGVVTDGRGLEDPKILGESQAKRPFRPVVSTASAADFVDQALRASLKEWNANVSEDAPLTLRTEIIQFSSMEQHRVAADVRFRFVLEDRNGKAIWQQEVVDDDGVWGSSLNEKNYIQAFSTATKRAFADLFNKTDFRAAVMKGAVAE